MGRYPFRALLPGYFNATASYKAPSTLANEKRILRRIAKIIDPSEPLTHNLTSVPKRIGEREIGRFVDKMNELELTPSTQKKYLQYLDNFLVWCDNPIIGKMRQLKHVHFPVEVEDEMPYLTQDELNTLIAAAQQIPGWKGCVARLMVAVYPSTGLRPSELRTLRYEDIELNKNILRVSNPKGVNRYGRHRTVPILEHIRPAFQEFLAEREEYLMRHGVEEHDALVPYCDRRRKVRYFSQAEWSKIKAVIRELSGIEFKLKDFRSTFCQRAIDNGAMLSSVSKILGHSTTQTTERYYGRIRDKAACDDIQRVWTEAHTKTVTKCVIDPPN